MSAGFTDAFGAAPAGVGLVTVPGAPTADDGPGAAVAFGPADAAGDAKAPGDADAAGGGRFFINSLRNALWLTV